MKTLLIDNGTTLLEKLQKLIPGDESVVHFDSFDQEQAQKADVVILSGSSRGQLIGNEAEFQKEIDFIRTTNKPIIGICFGYELIVHAFGGTLKELPEQEVGAVTITVLKDPELFYGKKEFETFENHRWGTEKLPKDFEVLAESTHGPEVIRHNTRPIYGLQFHPENHTDTSFGDEVFLKILERVVVAINL